MSHGKLVAHWQSVHQQSTCEGTCFENNFFTSFVSNKLAQNKPLVFTLWPVSCLGHCLLARFWKFKLESGMVTASHWKVDRWVSMSVGWASRLTSPAWCTCVPYIWRCHWHVHDDADANITGLDYYAGCDDGDDDDENRSAPLSTFYRGNQFTGGPGGCDTTLEMETKCFFHLLVLNNKIGVWKNSLYVDPSPITALQILLPSLWAQLVGEEDLVPPSLVREASLCQ